MQGAGTTKDRAVTTTEQGGNSPEYPGQALVTVNSNQNTNQERIRAQTSGPTSPTKVQITEGRLTRWLHPSKQNHKQNAGQYEMANKYIIGEETR